jgi:hypothetical protein
VAQRAPRSAPSTGRAQRVPQLGRVADGRPRPVNGHTQAREMSPARGALRVRVLLTERARSLELMPTERPAAGAAAAAPPSSASGRLLARRERDTASRAPCCVTRAAALAERGAFNPSPLLDPRVARCGTGERDVWRS